jgi:hypothetical protein
MINLLSACSNEVTGVRLVSVSYEGQNSNVFFSRYNTLSLSTNHSRLNSSGNYMFPGDVLTFTIELEDPNFEFVSLLLIQFNGVVIRANIGDSIIQTRGCGLNICIDFPFTVLKDTSSYTVEDIRFVKVNTEGSISAIIDNQSVKTLELNVFKNEIYPYVLASVDVLNQHFQSIEYFETAEQWRALTILEQATVLHSRMLSILFLENSPSTIDGTFNIDDDQCYYYHSSTLIPYDSNDISTWTYFGINGSITLKNDGYPKYYFNIDALHISFMNNIYASNEGNKIYLNIKGTKYFLIEMGQRTQFIIFPVPLNYYVTWAGYA